MVQPLKANEVNALKRVAAEWATYTTAVPADVRLVLHRVLQQHGDDLRARYGRYLADDEGLAAVIASATARQEFTDAFMSWVSDLMKLTPDCADEFRDKQVAVGRLVARIGLPSYAAARLMRKLKIWFVDYLARETISAQQLAAAMHSLITMIDLSMEIREISYQSDVGSHSRIDEAYRLHALGQNLAMERERQRALLMEWAHQILVSFHQSSAPTDLPRLWKSEFGLWLNHKARVLFERASEIESIISAVDRIDCDLVTGLEQCAFAERSAVASLLGRIEEELSAIKFKLNGLFESHLEVENGRDPLTKLLNRRFLPAVLMREIALQKKGVDQGFCVIMIDIDHFKRINDSYGHAAGDIALQQVASIANGATRPSDFAFRYGGEEIVIVLVDCGRSTAESVAQRIRQTIEHTPIVLPEGGEFRLTASLGLANYDGELDYEALLSRADDAMYKAKDNGRNNVVLAEGGATVKNVVASAGLLRGGR